jgi:multidrug efflux pump
VVRTLVHAATTVLLATACMFIFGLQSYVSLPRESAPDVEIPVVVVSTPYIGVAPADVEGLITIPLENELAGLADVKKMTSSSAEGVSIISIEFEPEVDIDEALQKVRDRVSRARPKIPEDAEDTTVSEISFSDIPVLLVTIAGDADEQALKELAEDLEDEVTRIPGVLEAVVTGGREREIHVEIDPLRLGHYGLALHDVTDAISGENVNIPGGDITSGRSSFLVRTPGEFKLPAEIEDVAIKRVGDLPVFVRDVGRVSDTFEDRKTYSRMNGQTAVTLAVKKRSGSNILQVAQSVKDAVAEASASWPAGVSYAITGDQSENIEGMVSELQNNIITALILVVAVILLFMGARNALFVALSIPLSMFMSFLALQALGFTLNMVVLFSLILALGMLVDNAIVVVENIYRHVEMGKPPMDAAVDGTNEVALAVAASTATTVAAFLPMVFWTGIMGQFMGYLPKTVIIVLTASLVAAIAVLPVMASRVMRRTGHDAPDDEDRPLDVATLSPMLRRYLGVLETAIDRRYTTLVAGVAVLVGTFMAYGVLNHGVEFFPATDPDRAFVNVRLPEGADLEATDKVVRAIEGVLAEVPNVETYVSEVGISAGGGGALGGTQEAGNSARVTLDFLPSADKADPGETIRHEPTPLTMLRLRGAFASIPGAAISVEQEEMGPPVGKPIAVEVRGDDFHEVGTAAIALLRELERIEGVTDLDADYRVGRPELRLRVDRGAAKRVGVSTQSVGGAVRTAIAGSKAGALREGDDEHDIIVRLATEDRADLQQILALRVPGREDTSPSTFPVPLSSVATYELAGGAGTIRHIDQDLVVTIQGDVTNKDEEAMIRQRVGAFLATWDAPDGITSRLGGAQDEQQASVEFLSWAFSVAVALILLVLVAQFDSLAMPAIILFTVILSLVGVLWGLVITGTPFGIMMTGIGVISLAGVVVNNAIVLLDYVQQLVARGLSPRDALLRAGVTRFRPVMLTAITTVLGLVPMAVGTSIDFTKMTIIFGSTSAQFWGPMAVAVIFGLSFATVLTLVMVPTLFHIWVDLSGAMARLFARAPVVAAAKLATLALGLAAAGVAQAAPVTLDEAFDAAEVSNLDLALVREQTRQTATFRWQALSAVLPRLTFGATFAINQNEVELDFTDQFQDFFGGGDTSIDPEAFLPLLTHPDTPFTASFLTEALQPAFESLFATPDIPASDPIVVQPKSAWSGSLTLYQPIFSGTALPTYIGANRLRRAAEADELRAQQQVRVGVARVFYALATAREAVAVSDLAVALARHQLDLASRQVAAGLSDRRAVLQAELALSRAERDLLGARANVVSAQETWARTTGLDRDAEPVIPDTVAAPTVLEDAVRTALSSRPDVLAGDERAEVARLERVAKDLEWLPDVSFTVTETYTQVPGFVPQNFQWRIGFNFDWVIFDGGLRIAQSRELASRRRSAQLAVAQTRQRVEEEVRTTFESLARAEQAYAAVVAEVSLAEESLRLAEAGFSAGTVTWLEVEQARLSLDSARLALATERMNRDVAAFELRAAIGQL